MLASFPFHRPDTVMLRNEDIILVMQSGSHTSLMDRHFGSQARRNIGPDKKGSVRISAELDDQGGTISQSYEEKLPWGIKRHRDAETGNMVYTKD